MSCLVPLLAPVAGSSAAAGANPPAAADAGERRDRDLYREALEAGELAEAEQAAKERIERLLASPDPTPQRTAAALSDLALVQRLAGRLDTAVQNYEAAIDLIQRDDDMLSSGLVDPLQGLAAAYRDMGRYARALETYERALHISHVNAGPHAVEQVQILQGMVDTNLAGSNVEAAFALLDRMTKLYERSYSLYAPELIPVLHEQAVLLSREDRHKEERQVYRRIARIQADSYGADDPALVNTYIAIGRTYLHEADQVAFRSEPTTQNGETYFRRAVTVAESNPAAGPGLLADCVLALGDYHTVMNSIDLARLQYGRAWEIMSVQGLVSLRESALEHPVPLRRVALGQYPDFNYGWSRADVDPSELLSGHIVARFRINDRGRVRDVELIESDPPGFTRMENRVRYGVREFIYRPAYRDGQPVESDDIVFTHEFFYRPEDLGND